jgi:hypothetical protein
VKGWSRVHTADNPAEVGFVRGLLEAEGIETHVRSMDLWAAAVEIYFAEGARPSVWVREQELDRARQVLAGADQRGQSRGWVCRRCGEGLDGQFTACWSCGTARDDD